MPCPGPDLCPLNGFHPPNGEEFALGCNLCKYDIESLPGSNRLLDDYDYGNEEEEPPIQENEFVPPI